MANAQKIYDHFRLEELTSGVYAAIATDDGKALSNAGFVNLGKETLLFDTFLNIDAAKDLHRLAEELTGNPVTYVVNSHFHLDHVVGNQIFAPEVTLISSEKTLQILRDSYPAALEHYRAHGEAALKEREEQLKNEEDAMTRHSLQNDLLFLRALVGYPLTARLPELTFTDRFTFYGSERQAVLWSFPVGHTPGDTALYLPDDGVIFMGDLLCAGNHPWLGHGNPDDLQKIFAELGTLDLQHVVPGHGPVSTTAAMVLENRYITEVKQIASRLKKSGEAPEKASLADLSPEFANWDSKVCFSWNIGFLYEKLG